MYAYDAAQRLTSITPPGLSPTSFTLDALGRPLTRGTDTYSYVGSSETAWRISDGAGATVSAIDADGGRASVASSSDFGWLLGDLHGNVAVALNQAETAVSSALRYDGYGQTLDSYAAGTLPTPWRYQGRLDVSPDADNPLYDAGARFYSPAIGAFTQLDTVSGSAQDPWSMNRYLYAGANPTSMIDPDGHAFFENADPDKGKKVAYSTVRTAKSVKKVPHYLGHTASTAKPKGHEKSRQVDKGLVRTVTVTTLTVGGDLLGGSLKAAGRRSMASAHNWAACVNWGAFRPLAIGSGSKRTLQLVG